MSQHGQSPQRPFRMRTPAQVTQQNSQLGMEGGKPVVLFVSPNTETQLPVQCVAPSSECYTVQQQNQQLPSCGYLQHPGTVGQRSTEAGLAQVLIQSPAVHVQPGSHIQYIIPQPQINIQVNQSPLMHTQIPSSPSQQPITLTYETPSSPSQLESTVQNQLITHIQGSPNVQAQDLLQNIRPSPSIIGRHVVEGSNSSPKQGSTGKWPQGRVDGYRVTQSHPLHTLERPHKGAGFSQASSDASSSHHTVPQVANTGGLLRRGLLNQAARKHLILNTQQVQQNVNNARASSRQSDYQTYNPRMSLTSEVFLDVNTKPEDGNKNAVLLPHLSVQNSPGTQTVVLAPSGPILTSGMRHLNPSLATVVRQNMKTDSHQQVASAVQVSSVQGNALTSIADSYLSKDGSSSPDNHSPEAVSLSNSEECMKVAESSMLNPNEQITSSLLPAGVFAICTNCGSKSMDSKLCTRCKRPLPPDARRYAPNEKTANITVTKRKSAGIDKAAFYSKKILTFTGAFEQPNIATVVTDKSVKKPKKRSGKSKAKHVEPECLTLSSDDEDATVKQNTVQKTLLITTAKPGTGTVNKPNDANVTKPAVIPDNPDKEKSSHSLPKRQIITDKDGKTFTLIPVAKVPPTVMGTASPIGKIERIESSLQILCSSIRIGSLRSHGGTPYLVVHETHLTLMFFKNSIGHLLRMDASSLVSFLVHVDKPPHIVFAYCTSICADELRKRLEMTDGSAFYFDPASEDESQRRITIVPDKQMFTVAQANSLVDRLKALQSRSAWAKVDSSANRSSFIQFLDDKRAQDMFMDSFVSSQNQQLCETDSETLVRRISTRNIARPGIHDNQANTAVVVAATAPAAHGEKIIVTSHGDSSKLCTYPPPPAKGGITITEEDFYCLNECEFLNDVIVDFYLKYLVENKIRVVDKNRTHVFNSFFFKRLTERHAGHKEDHTLPIMERRHNRVKTWTRHVDVFEKDFLIIPVNECAHWFLAVVCFPWLSTATKVVKEEGTGDTLPAITKLREAALSEMKTNLPPPPSPALTETEREDGSAPMETDKEEGIVHSMSSSNLSVMSEDTNPDEVEDDNESPNVDADEMPISGLKAGQLGLIQPCILIFDSLAESRRSKVINYLRDYIQIEWNSRKAIPREFTKQNMRGTNVKCQQQDNFSDCGIYVLQYVESFFENPISSYTFPMKLHTWFSKEHVDKKRTDIQSLVMQLNAEQFAQASASNSKTSTDT